jgi:hypothetical protein
VNELTDAEFLVYDLEADADGVYVTQLGAAGVRFLPAGGGTEQSLPCPPFWNCEQVELAGDLIYSFARASIVIGGWGIHEVTKLGATAHAFARNLNLGEILSVLRADDVNGFVYFSTDTSSGADLAGTIRKAPKCTSGMSTDVVILPLFTLVTDFAIGPQSLYFSSGGQIFVAPK